MTATPPSQPWRISGTVGKLLLAAGLAGGLVLLLLLLAGYFKAKVPAQTVASQRPVPASAQTGQVRLLRRPQQEAAVGTVRAVHEAAVAAKLLARVVEVNVKAGQAVTRDQVLIRLDDADLQARLRQAEASARAAKANLEKAETDFGRAEKLRPTNAISKEEYERTAAIFRTAKAEADRTEQAIKEAKVLVDHATIRAPLTGTVIDKKVEVGDMVVPGQVLLTLYDPTRMQMVATVRESLATRLQVGQKLPGRLDALGHDCEATVSEIVPEAQAASRSFLVKVTGPCPPGVYSGMFGRIYIPLGEEEAVIVPQRAVLQIGQLDLVDVVVEGQLRRRNVQLGRTFAEGREVLAGLKPGELVVLQARSQEATK